jgi:hypothetical protein
VSRSTLILCLVGILASVPLVWFAASAVFAGASQSKERADCISVSQSVFETIESIDKYYREDGRSYSEFVAQNSDVIDAQLAAYRDERTLDLRITWHPVDRYFWSQRDLEYLSVLCPQSELERQTRQLQALSERHDELATTTSNFVSEWDIQ